MTLQPGQIVKNLIPSEAVTINRVQNLGASVSISFTGVNTKRANTKVISSSDLDALEILTDEGTEVYPIGWTAFSHFLGGKIWSGLSCS